MWRLGFFNSDIDTLMTSAFSLWKMHTIASTFILLRILFSKWKLGHLSQNVFSTRRRCSLVSTRHFLRMLLFITYWRYNWRPLAWIPMLVRGVACETAVAARQSRQRIVYPVFIVSYWSSAVLRVLPPPPLIRRDIRQHLTTTFFAQLLSKSICLSIFVDIY